MCIPVWLWACVAGLLWVVSLVVTGWIYENDTSRYKDPSGYVWASFLAAMLCSMWPLVLPLILFGGLSWGIVYLVIKILRKGIRL